MEPQELVRFFGFDCDPVQVKLLVMGIDFHIVQSLDRPVNDALRKKLTGGCVQKLPIR